MDSPTVRVAETSDGEALLTDLDAAGGKYPSTGALLAHFGTRVHHFVKQQVAAAAVTVADGDPLDDTAIAAAVAGDAAGEEDVGRLESATSFTLLASIVLTEVLTSELFLQSLAGGRVVARTPTSIVPSESAASVLAGTPLKPTPPGTATSPKPAFQSTGRSLGRTPLVPRPVVTITPGETMPSHASVRKSWNDTTWLAKLGVRGRMGDADNAATSPRGDGTVLGTSAGAVVHSGTPGGVARRAKKAPALNVSGSGSGGGGRGLSVAVSLWDAAGAAQGLDDADRGVPSLSNPAVGSPSHGAPDSGTVTAPTSPTGAATALVAALSMLHTLGRRLWSNYEVLARQVSQRTAHQSQAITARG